MPLLYRTELRPRPSLDILPLQSWRWPPVAKGRVTTGSRILRQVPTGPAGGGPLTSRPNPRRTLPALAGSPADPGGGATTASIRGLPDPARGATLTTIPTTARSDLSGRPSCGPALAGGRPQLGPLPTARLLIPRFTVRVRARAPTCRVWASSAHQCWWGGWCGRSSASADNMGPPARLLASSDSSRRRALPSALPPRAAPRAVRGRRWSPFTTDRRGLRRTSREPFLVGSMP